jgi:alcohol dehydrogenase
LVLAGLPVKARDAGMELERVPELAAEAAKQWTAQYNPVPLDEAGMADLYRAAF